MDDPDRAMATQMSADQRAAAIQTARPWHVRMGGRDPAETHRAATPLELLFDLCFVVAVAQAAELFHQVLSSSRAVDAGGLPLADGEAVGIAGSP